MMPRVKELVDRYNRALIMVHPWASGDVNVFDPMVRERIKELRALGFTHDEIQKEVHRSVETIRSILDHDF